MVVRWVRRYGLSVALAHALAVLVFSHVHYSGWCPKGQSWLWYEVATAIGVWPLCILLLNRWVRPTLLSLPIAERRQFGAVAVGLGLCIAAWWANGLENNQWLFPPAVRLPLGAVLALSHWLVASAGVAVFLSATVRTLRSDSAALPDVKSDVPRFLSGRFAVQLLVVVIFFAAVSAFVVWYVQQERIVYYWDYMAYWAKTAELAGAMRTSSLGSFLNELFWITQFDDYGPFPAVPVAAVELAFGDSRLVYVLAVANLYLVGFGLAAVLFVRRMLSAPTVFATVMPLLLVACSGVAWAPVLRGYLDIGGAAIATLVLLTYLGRPAGELGWRKTLQLAVLLVALALFRRWYSFFVVAFFVVAGLDTAIVASRGLIQGGWKVALRRVAPLAFAGLWAVGLLFVFAWGWVIRAATTNYSDAYSAYKHTGSFRDGAWYIIDVCGPWHFALLAAAVLTSLGFRDVRRPVWVIAGMVPVMAYHFLRTQDPGPHHYYLFLPALVLVPSLVIVRAVSRVPASLGWCVAMLMGVVGTGAMYAQFHPQGFVCHARLRPAVSLACYPPMTRPDLPELIRVLKDADAAAPEGGTIAVASSSYALNPTLLLVADRSLGESVVDRRKALITREVDRNAGFPLGYFQADVIVAADPLQCHLRVEEQQVVVIFAESLLKNQDVGHAFDRLPGEYRMYNPEKNQDATAYLFRRARPISKGDFDAYVAKLKAAHPTRPQLSEPPSGFEKYLAFPLPKP